MPEQVNVGGQPSRSTAARTCPRSGPSPAMTRRAGMARRRCANASTARTGDLRGSSRPTQNTTGMPGGCGRGSARFSLARPSASMNRTSLAPRRFAAASVAELHTRVTAEFRSVSRLLLFSLSSDPVAAVRSVSTGPAHGQNSASSWPGRSGRRRSGRRPGERAAATAGCPGAATPRSRGGPRRTAGHLPPTCRRAASCQRR